MENINEHFDIVEKYDKYMTDILELADNPTFFYSEIANKLNRLVSLIIQELSPNREDGYIKRNSPEFMGLILIAYDCFRHIRFFQENIYPDLYESLIMLIPKSLEEEEKFDKMGGRELPF